MPKARLIFPLSELQSRKVLLFLGKWNKRSDFYYLKIRNTLEGLRLAGISATPEPKLGSKWGKSSGFGSWGSFLPSCKTLQSSKSTCQAPK